MLQIKLVLGEHPESLSDSVNEFLSSIKTEAVKDIKVDFNTLSAVIQYEVKEAWVGHICADCKYWDDGGSPSSVGGLCHECGSRRRFNCNACSKFQDIRG